MPSDQSVDISDLVCATEGNIARITIVSGKFAVPCLNEWRYATKHVALLLKNPADTVQREKAIGAIATVATVLVALAARLWRH